MNRVAQVALAGLAAVYMATAPAAHAATVKQVLCASNPTSKVRPGSLCVRKVCTVCESADGHTLAGCC